MSPEPGRVGGVTGLEPIGTVKSLGLQAGSSALLTARAVGVDSVERPFRNGTLRDILDEEFSRSYRFEGVSDLIHDIESNIKHLWRRVVGRDGEREGLEDLESSLRKHN